MADSEKVSSLPSERERFEAWAKTYFFSLVRHYTGDSYNSLTTDAAWMSWQASSAGRQELLDCLARYVAQDEARGGLEHTNLYRTGKAILSKHEGADK